MNEQSTTNPVYTSIESLKENLKDIGAEIVHYTDNRTLSRDCERALPALSVRFTIKGGKKKEIAKLIWELKPLGVLTVGTTSTKVKDSYGFKHKIYFEHI